MVSHAREVDAHLPCDLRVGITGVSPRAHEPGELERRQPVTLLVLRDLGIDVMGFRANDDGDCAEIRLLGSPEPLGAEDDTVSVVVGRPAHDDGLKDAAQSNVLGELGDLLVGKFGPRVGRIFVKAVDRDDEGKPGSGRIAWDGGRGSADRPICNVDAEPRAWLSARLVDKVELLDLQLRFGPRHAHGRIVPLSFASWKSPLCRRIRRRSSINIRRCPTQSRSSFSAGHTSLQLLKDGEASKECRVHPLPAPV